VSLHIYNGQWLISGSGPAVTSDCCCGNEDPTLGACCWDNDGTWTCTQESEESCLARSGTWQGEGSSCEYVDCTRGCCENVTVDDTCIVFFCRRGYTESGGCVECDPDEPFPPLEGTTSCEGGTPTQVSVSCSGFVPNTGDPAADAVFDTLINASYQVDLICTGFGSADFPSGAYTVRVSVGLTNARSASILVISNATNSGVASVAFNASPETSSVSECGNEVYPCSGYSGAASSGSGTGGTISVSGV
jgi:hypothetical protein